MYISYNNSKTLNFLKSVKLVWWIFLFFFRIFYFFLHFVQWANKCKLFHKLSNCYMFRHNRVILRDFVISNLPSYTSMSNAVVGRCKLFNQQKYLCNLARYWLQTPWGWHDSVETCSSSVIIRGNNYAFVENSTK